MAAPDEDDDDVGVEPQSKEQQQLNAMGADREEKELDTSKFVGAIGSVEEEHKSAQIAKAQRCARVQDPTRVAITSIIFSESRLVSVFPFQFLRPPDFMRSPASS
jgi:hypothetical protein